jgi:hypothetical protein
MNMIIRWSTEEKGTASKLQLLYLSFHDTQGTEISKGIGFQGGLAGRDQQALKLHLYTISETPKILFSKKQIKALSFLPQLSEWRERERERSWKREADLQASITPHKLECWCCCARSSPTWRHSFCSTFATPQLWIPQSSTTVLSASGRKEGETDKLLLLLLSAVQQHKQDWEDWGDTREGHVIISSFVFWREGGSEVKVFLERGRIRSQSPPGEREDQKSKSSCLLVDRAFLIFIFLNLGF